MKTASAVYVQIKHQLLWASVPLLTCGGNIRYGKGQLWDYEWNCFRWFRRMSWCRRRTFGDRSSRKRRPHCSSWSGARIFPKTTKPSCCFPRPFSNSHNAGRHAHIAHDFLSVKIPNSPETNRIGPAFHRALFQRSQNSWNQTTCNYLISLSDCCPKVLSNNQPRCSFHLPTLSECSPLIRNT